MTPGCGKDKLGKDLPPGSQHWRAFVGPAERYDLVSAMQFNLVTLLGLREHHYLLDIGCGSLRGGKLFIPYLLPGRYFGIEPEQWLIDEGMRNEIGDSIIAIKKPVFSNDSDFRLGIFGISFDFILAQSIFSHASQRQIRRCLYEAKKVLKPDGFFAATFCEGEEDYSGDEWVYPDVVTYSLQRMVALAEEQCLVCKAIDWPHPNQQTWVVIAHPTNEQNIPDLGNIAHLLRLKNELMLTRERLARIEGHPYVRLGFKLKRFLHWLRHRPS